MESLVNSRCKFQADHVPSPVVVATKGHGESLAKNNAEVLGGLSCVVRYRRYAKDMNVSMMEVELALVVTSSTHCNVF